MMPEFDTTRDLQISRIIRAPRSRVWRAWVDPKSFEQWWIPAPARCKVIELDARPGGALVTHMDEGSGFVPHVEGSFVEVFEEERLVFTDALLKGWRPGPAPFMTAIITLKSCPEGTLYHAHVMHKDAETQQLHAQMGFELGWGAVTEQLARIAEAAGKNWTI